MKDGIILHSENPLQEPNWKELRSMAEETAATRLTAILSGCDRVEKRVYALRGMAMLLVEERQLFRWVIDEEVGDYFVSFDRWLKQTCPESWSYCRQALNAVKELREMPFEDLLSIKRANLEQLKRVSSNVRLLPAVIEAAKTLPEKAFVEKLNRDHAQHLEVKQPVALAPAGDVAEFESAIEMAMLVEHCDTRADAIKAIAVSYIQDHATEFEHLKEESA